MGSRCADLQHYWWQRERAYVKAPKGRLPLNSPQRGAGKGATSRSSAVQSRCCKPAP